MACTSLPSLRPVDHPNRSRDVQPRVALKKGRDDDSRGEHVCVTDEDCGEEKGRKQRQDEEADDDKVQGLEERGEKSEEAKAKGEEKRVKEKGGKGEEEDVEGAR